MWTATVTYNQVYSTTIAGLSTPSGASSDGLGNPTGFNDVTIIEDEVSNSNVQTLVINTAANKTFRMTGLSFLYTTAQTNVRNTGVIGINGNSHSVRIDHNHFNGGVGYRMANYGSANAWGVTDHNLFDEANDTNVNQVEMNGANWGGLGDSWGNESWADLSYWGSDKFMYFENNTFSSPSTTDTTGGATGMDLEEGARAVFRYNTWINVRTQTHVLGHGGSGNLDRSPRAWEFYGNYLSYPCCGGYYAVMDYEGGTSLYWGNNIGAGFTTNFIREDNRRATGDTYAQGAPPNGWGYCGTSLGPSVWDENLDSTGQACLDGVGRGKGDLITGNAWPNVVDSVTGTQTWPHQVLDQVYVWDNTLGPGTGTYFGHDNATVENRDYYLQLPNVNESATFNGTAGIGQGLSSAKPSTCTPYVGWWATDQNILYQCSATNTWTVYYTPYTYPHPLVGSTSTWGAMNVWLRMNTSTPGTALTSAILGAGSVGTPALSSWSLLQSNTAATSTSAFTVAPSQGTMGGSIIVNGVTYPDGSATQSLALNGADNYTYVTTSTSFPSGISQVVCNGYFTFGWTSQASPPGNNIDMLALNDFVSAGAVVLQGNNVGGTVVRIETNGSDGFIGRSSNITVTPGHRYSFSLLYDGINGVAQLAVFDPSNGFAQVGSTVTEMQTKGSTFADWRFGNFEIGYASGTTSYFDNLMLDWTNHIFPNAPAGVTSSAPPNPPTGLSISVQ